MDIPIEVVKQELRLLYIGHYVNCSILCLAAYDFVITFGQEVAVVWRRKWTVTSTLLLGVRWLMVIGPVLSLISIPDSWCGAESILTAAIYMAGLALIALFSALRIYALWQDSRLKWVLAAAVLALLLVPVGTNLFAVVKNATEILILPPGLHICVNYINASPKLNTKLLYLTRSCVIAADVLVLALTWAKSFSHFREMRRLKLTSSLAGVLLRDGTVYFAALLAMSILQLLMFTAHGFSEGGDVTNFLEHMPLVLVQRFMLNLRQLNPSAHDLSSDAHQVSNFSINFRPASDVLGNIGEPLDHGRSNWSSREDDERDDVGSTMEPPDASDGDEAKFGSSISVEVSLA